MLWLVRLCFLADVGAWRVPPTRTLGGPFGALPTEPNGAGAAKGCRRLQDALHVPILCRHPPVCWRNVGAVGMCGGDLHGHPVGAVDGGTGAHPSPAATPAVAAAAGVQFVRWWGCPVYLLHAFGASRTCGWFACGACFSVLSARLLSRVSHTPCLLTAPCLVMCYRAVALATLTGRPLHSFWCPFRAAHTSSRALTSPRTGLALPSV